MEASVNLQTALAAAEAHPAEREWLEKRLNIEKLCTFQAET
jgi:hypothetical protein